METTLVSIKVPVTFRGTVEVKVPADAPFKEKLAQAIALSRIVATDDNPDAPDEAAFEDYCNALEISDDNPQALLVAGGHFDHSSVASISGAWNGVPLPNIHGFFPGAPGFTGGPAVPARITSDKDPDRELIFDASLWFEHASDEDILELSRRYWCRSYEADNVARFFTGRYMNPEIAEFLDKATEGFEVFLSGDDAMTWLSVHRPHLNISE